MRAHVHTCVHMHMCVFERERERVSEWTFFYISLHMSVDGYLGGYVLVTYIAQLIIKF